MFSGRLATDGLKVLSRSKRILSEGVKQVSQEPKAFFGSQSKIKSHVSKLIKHFESVKQEEQAPLLKSGEPSQQASSLKSEESSPAAVLPLSPMLPWTAFSSLDEKKKADMRNLAEKRLADADLLPPDIYTDAFKQRMQSARVFYIKEHFPDDNLVGDKAFSLERAITKAVAADISGSHAGETFTGEQWPGSSFFMTLKPGDPRGLSPEERVNAKNISISSEANVYQFGGYPTGSHIVPLKKPMKIYVFTVPGQQLEDPRLDYNNCFVDQYVDAERHAKLSAHMAEDGKQINYTYILTEVFPLMRYVTRDPMTGKFSSSFLKSKAIILDRKAYGDALRDQFTLLFSAATQLTDSSKPTYFKLSLMGMGFFSEIGGAYDINGYLTPIYFDSLVEALKRGSFGNLKCVEIPLFTERAKAAAASFAEGKEEIVVNGVTIYFNHDVDILDFSGVVKKEQFNLCVLNPSDAHAVPGNEIGSSKNHPASVESAIGNNTDIRYIQNFLLNPAMVKKENWIGISVSGARNGLFKKDQPSSPASNGDNLTSEQEDLQSKRVGNR